MFIINDETASAIQQAFRTRGKDAAVAELRRRYWILDGLIDKALERLLAHRPA